MTGTVKYGTWSALTRGTRDNPTQAETVEATLAVFLGENFNDYDTRAIIADYREAVNAALPNQVSLNGNEFYGPSANKANGFDDYSRTERGELDIAAIVDSVSLEEIAWEHNLTAF